MDSTILVATASQGIIRSADQGETWHRIGLGQAIEFDGVVRSLTSDPRDRRIILAGADAGLCRSDDIGSTWKLMDTPFAGQTVWKVVLDPANPDRIFCGTGAPSRAALWRTLNGGATWTRVTNQFPEFCAGVNRPRLLAFAYNPRNPSQAWFGLEAGGLFRTCDGGDSWEQIDDRLLWDYHSDVHAIQVLPDEHETVMVVCVNAIYTSRDGGDTWHGMLPKKEFGLYYARALATPPDSADAVFVSLADGTPGTTSRIIVSNDGARTWRACTTDTNPSSCFWSVHVNPGDSNCMAAGTKYGELYLSHDAGKSWRRQWRSFPEITDVHCVPVAAQIQASHRSDVA